MMSSGRARPLDSPSAGHSGGRLRVGPAAPDPGCRGSCARAWGRCLITDSRPNRSPMCSRASCSGVWQVEHIDPRAVCEPAAGTEEVVVSSFTEKMFHNALTSDQGHGHRRAARTGSAHLG